MESLTSVKLNRAGYSKLSFGLVTPSFAPDFERCQLLCRTRERCLSTSVKHYIIVDRRDFSLFNTLRNRSTEILVVEDVLPWWIQRIPCSKQGWVSLKTPPIRNWILQQLVKLAIANVIDEDILGFVDSDVAFVRPFNYQSFIRQGQVRLYRESQSIPATWRNFRRWYHRAAKLLGVDQVQYPAPNFISDLVIWKSSNVVKLQQHLENRSGKSWLELLAGTLHWSEYILYGLFIESVLKDSSGHYYDESYPGLHYFSEEPMSEPEIQAFLCNLQPHHLTVMISAKANIPAQRYAPYLLSLESLRITPQAYPSAE
jgi:hypothetical protein